MVEKLIYVHFHSLFNRKQHFLLEIQKNQDILDNIRKYNCAFQPTTFGCKEVTLHGWNPQFRIQGRVCHLIGSRGLPLKANQYMYYSRFTLWMVQQQIRWKGCLCVYKHNSPDYRIVMCESRRSAGTHERTSMHQQLMKLQF